MVQIEVAQASLRRWTPLLKVEESRGLFLEIYPDMKDTKKTVRCPRSCVCRCRNKPSLKQMPVRTDVVPESRDMRWRRYNNDGFLVALFSITGPAVSRIRRGDSVTMVADLFREPLETDASQAPVWLGTFHAIWIFGLWGTVHLRPSQDSIENGLQDDLELTLDLRPRQSRPFSLQNAKPYLERATIEEISARVASPCVRSLSDMSVSEGHFSSILPRHASRTIKAVYKGFLNLKKNLVDEELRSDGREKGFSVSFSTTNEDALGSASDIVSSYRPIGKEEHLGSFFNSAATSSHPIFPSSSGPHRGSVLAIQHSASEASHLENSMANSFCHIPSTLGYESNPGTSSSGFSECTDTTGRSRFGKSASRKSRLRASIASGRQPSTFGSRSTFRSTLTDLRSSLAASSARSNAYARANIQSRDPFQKIAEKALRMRVPNFFSKTRSEKQLVDWVPQDWHQLWKKLWPLEADELTEGIEVTPIMEAEFRKDCLVFFNSMFPRVDGERFTLFRDLAFARHSKLRFPILRKFDRGVTVSSFGPRGSGGSRHCTWGMAKVDSIYTSRGSDGEESEDDSDDDMNFETLSSAGTHAILDIDVDNLTTSSARRKRQRARFCCCRKLGRRRGGPGGIFINSGHREDSTSSTNAGSQVSRVYSGASRRERHSIRRNSTNSPGKVVKLDSSESAPATPLASTPERSSIKTSDSAADSNWLEQFKVLNEEQIPSERDPISTIDRLDHDDGPNRPSLSQPSDCLRKLQQKGPQSASASDDDGDRDDPSVVGGFRLPSGKRTKDVVSKDPTAVDSIEVSIGQVSLHRQATSEQLERSIGDVTPFFEPCFHDPDQDSGDFISRRVNGIAFREDSAGAPTTATEHSRAPSPEISRATATVLSGDHVIQLDAHNVVAAYDSMSSSISGTLHYDASTQRSEVTSMRSLRSADVEATLSGDSRVFRGRRHSITSTVTDQPYSLNVLSTFSLNGCVYADEYSPRIMVMKRLFLCFAFCGVYYTEVSNSPQLGELWPYPMATILGHGSRILIRLEDVEGSAFLNFLLFGDPRCLNWKETGVPPPLKTRIAATHSVQIETETGQLIERRLKLNTMDTLQNIADGIYKRHLGLNLPIGGVANPSAVGSDQYIDFTGRIVRQVDPTMKSTASVVRFMSGFASTGINSVFDDSIDEADDTKSNSDTKWMPLPKVQGGHLYIRVDEFGNHLSCWSNVFSGDAREDSIKELRTISDRDTVELELFKRKAQVENQTSAAGVLFFASQVPALKVKHRNGLHYVADNDTIDDSQQRGLCLLRVSSDPCIHYSTLDADPEDIKWMNRMIKCRRHIPLALPPSAEALEMLLRHYHPMKAQFFGTAGHNTFNEFFKELVDQKSFLIKGDSRLERVVEPLILRLQWRNCVLMLTHEVKPDQDHPVHKRTFVCARMTLGETWLQAAKRALKKELDLRYEDVVKTLTGASLDIRTCHRVIEESAVSPSYPGIRTFYRTHHVEWCIRDECVGFFSFHGLPPNLAKRDTTPCNSDFSTSKHTPIGIKTLYWRWVDVHVARTLQPFLNMGEANPDERWAKYAFQQNGIIHPPPSDVALGILFKRCGIDITKYGENGRKSLSQLRVEALNQECHLIMSKGHLLRVAEDVLVRLRCRKTDIGYNESLDLSSWIVLVRVNMEIETISTSRQEKDEDCGYSSPRKHRHREKDVKKYALIRGRKDREEAWQDAALSSVSRDLGLTKSQVKGLLEPGLKPGDASVRFYEERTESPSYPALETLYKTHLVTLTVRHDIIASSSQHFIFGATESDNHDFSWRGSDDTGATPITPPPSRNRRNNQTCVYASAGNLLCQAVITSTSGREFQWMSEEKANEIVSDAKLWQEVSKRQEKRNVHSVLLGLEGSAPQCKSPFGTAHNIKGASSKISANGNRKWRAYRTNNALQIPASEGGMRLKIGRKQFEELVETCELLDLLDPKLELAFQNVQAYLPKMVNGHETLRLADSNTWQVIEARTEEEIVGNGDKGIKPDPFGRGLAYRTRKDVDAIMTSRQNLVKGATIEGYDEGDGWVRVQVKEAWRRELLDQRYAEKELFKQVLSGNGDEAKQAVSWMKEYRATHKSSARVYKDIAHAAAGKKAPKEVPSPRRKNVGDEFLAVPSARRKNAGDESLSSRQTTDIMRRVLSRT